MTIEDELVSVDSLIEDYFLEEPRNEFIQSCDIVAFNKICKHMTDILLYKMTFIWGNNIKLMALFQNVQKFPVDDETVEEQNL